jgi:hypothetical protein
LLTTTLNINLKRFLFFCNKNNLSLFATYNYSNAIKSYLFDGSRYRVIKINKNDTTGKRQLIAYPRVSPKRLALIYLIKLIYVE